MRKAGRSALKKQGFTLPEVLLTIGIITVVVTSALMLNIKIQQSQEMLYDQNVAYQDANRVLESMRRTAENGTFPGNVTTAFPNAAAVPGFTGLPGEIVTVNYADGPDAGANPLDDDPLNVTAAVSWNSVRGTCPGGPAGTRCVALNTRITKRT